MWRAPCPIFFPTPSQFAHVPHPIPSPALRSHPISFPSTPYPFPSYPIPTNPIPSALNPSPSLDYLVPSPPMPSHPILFGPLPCTPIRILSHPIPWPESRLSSHPFPCNPTTKPLMRSPQSHLPRSSTPLLHPSAPLQSRAPLYTSSILPSPAVHTDLPYLMKTNQYTLVAFRGDEQPARQTRGGGDDVPCCWRGFTLLVRADGGMGYGVRGMCVWV